VSTDALLRLVIFFALGVPILLLLRRVFVMGGQLRRDAQHGRAAVDIARRTDMSLAELSVVVDDLRRRKAGPEGSGASLLASAEALRRYAREAEAIDEDALRTAGAGLGAEIERAQRAVDLIEHGRLLMLGASAGGVAEGETAVKRGYLNLLHAREAIRARADEIAAAAASQVGRNHVEGGRIR
jgi:uncharacterized protein YfaS (alpha-2-macroglobulin family)